MPLLLTAAGPGAPGEIVPPDPPDPPTNLLAASITTSGATLSWTAPVSGGTPDGYEIEVQVAGGDWSSPVFTGTSGTTSKAVTGLASGTLYDARVRSTNGAGDSAWLEEEDLFTTGAVPVNTVAPSISGTAQQGQTLTRSTGTWTGTATITYTQQWKRYTTGGVFVENISGATSSTYELAAGDVGYKIGVTVTGTNAFGSAATDSALTAEVTASGGSWAVPNTVLILAGSNITGLSDGDPVATWPDSSGSGDDATQGSGAARPEYVAADPAFNNQPTVLFNGTSAFLNCGFTVSQPCTFFMVESSTEAGTDYWVDGSGSNRISMGFGLSGTPAANRPSVFAGGSVITAPSAITGPRIWRFEVDGASSKLFINGVQVASGNVGSNSLSDMTIGARSTLYLAGTLADLRVCTGIPSSGDAAAGEAFLASTYGITL